MQAKIYKPAKNAMQSGWANTRKWLLVYEPQRPKRIDDLMGYTSSDDTSRQVRLSFDTQEEAVAYAEKHGLSYQVQEPHVRQLRIKAYADNFKYTRQTRSA
ncbi:ETC complex I subunit [Emcibacter sp. SYSU 3D8]|uniref:ETC complex I subunit n=1 Tax=Emcibacter sp. SYSU 3D8 TaxID=3133969 RepID=UPI0031FF161E